MRTTAFVVVLAGLGSISSAEPIMFTHTGTGSGNIAGVDFFDRDFTITALGDTDDRVDLGFGYAIEHTSASIDIDGVGSFTFLLSTRSFVNWNLNRVGFSRSEFGGLGGSDLYNGPSNGVFNMWDMTTSIGPIAGDDFELFQWDSGVDTDGGLLDFFDESPISGTFTATIVPAPGTIGLLGLMGLAGTRRRR